MTNANATGLEVQLGRFSMELGSGRLIAQEAYRDVTRTFTGAKVRWRPTGSGTLTAFAVLPVLTLPADRESLLDNRIDADEEHLNQKLWGHVRTWPALAAFTRRGLPVRAPRTGRPRQARNARSEALDDWWTLYHWPQPSRSTSTPRLRGRVEAHAHRIARPMSGR